MTYYDAFIAKWATLADATDKLAALIAAMTMILWWQANGYSSASQNDLIVAGGLV